MNNNPRILNPNELHPLDVILCYGEGCLARKIARKTGSKYTHAAICVNPTEAAELRLCGIRKTNISKLVPRYPHVAVLRQAHPWSTKQIQAMQQFVQESLHSHRKYNLLGLLTFVRNKKEHDLTVLAKIRAYSAGVLLPSSHIKESYFCSEFVGDCFIATGYIPKNLTVAYKSNTISPGGLGRDGAFGMFLGYITSRPGWTIPADDDFINTPPLDER